MIHFPYADALCALPQPYSPDAVPARLFDRAMAEISLFHCHHTPGYEDWLNANDLAVSDLEHMTDWSQLPPVYARDLKQQLWLSPTAENALEFTSRGSDGQPSRMHYDPRSLAAAQGMLARIFDHYGWSTPGSPCNYLLLSQPPGKTNHLYSAYVDQVLCRFAPTNHVIHGLRRTRQGYELDVSGVIRALLTFAGEGLPVRVFGPPARLWLALERMRETGIRDLTLAPTSLVLLEGGWETPASPAMLHERITRQLGVDAHRCRDGYRTVEHAVPYLECAHHRFHVPVYSRVFVRHPSDFSVQPFGAPGLLSFVSPYISSSAAHAVVMDDLATLHPANCGCGLGTQWFEVHGRDLAAGREPAAGSTP